MLTETRAAERGLPHFEDGGRFVPSRTRYDMPERDVRPYLTFDRIAYYDGQPEAVFKGPDDSRYSLSSDKVKQAFRTEMEAALAGDLYFTLPNFQLAQHAFRNSRVDRAIRRVVDEVEEKVVIGSAALAAIGTVLYVGMAGVTTAINAYSNVEARVAFEDVTARKVGDTSFAVNTPNQSAALGTSDKGEYWRFIGNEHVYCTVEKGRNPYYEHTRWASWMSTEYAHKCAGVETLPVDHKGVNLYPAALLAYLQVARPAANYTPAMVEGIIGARRDAHNARQRYDAIKP